MADINFDASERPRPPADPADGGVCRDVDEVALKFVELLFFAYRDFTHQPDDILDEFGFGRAHHRVLHFVYRNPGLRVADLLDILRITKQSLARVLKQLITEDFIRQEAGTEDRRERLLFVTPRGRDLAEKLITLQTGLIGGALEAAGPEASDAIRRFLLSIVGEADRDGVRAIVDARAVDQPSSNGRDG